LFLLAPGLKKYPAKLNLKAMSFSLPDSLMFTAAVIKMPDDKELSAADPLGNVTKSLADAGLDIKDVRAAVANEAAVQVDWAAGALYPSPLLIIELKDRASALKLLTAATSKSPSDGEWSSKSEDGVDYRIFTPKKPNSLSPTVAVTGTHLVAGISQNDVRAAVTRAKGSGGRLDGNAAFKTAMADVGKPEISAFYLDAKSLFEKLYGLGKSLTPMAQAQVKDNVDLSKLPQTETIAKHLSSVVWSARETDDGILCESVGPLTLNQMLVTGAGLGALGAAMFKGVVSPDVIAPPAPGGAAPGSTQPDSSSATPAPPSSGTPVPTPPKPGG
jgi:hypothetical protein